MSSKQRQEKEGIEMTQCRGSRSIDDGFEYCQLFEDHAEKCMFPGDPEFHISMLTDRVQALEEAISAPS